MDFIKTSSLRALIELTFQRKWNGLIWMSRKGVIAKRVKTAPDGSIENQRPNRADRLAEERMFRARPKPSVRLKSRPKFNHPAERIHDPGNNVPRSAKPRTSHTAHDRARAGKNASRPRNLTRTTADVRPSRENVRVRPRNIGQILIRPTTTADRETSGHDRSDSTNDPISDRPSERRGRPEAVFEAQSAQFKPKAGADLARLAFQVFLVRYGEGATSLSPIKAMPLRHIPPQRPLERTRDVKPSSTTTFMG
ncbi:unnamed protein product [Microthlaspi erraticum]|uniref:Uncharacterized protein n=1 Tax=Microthlaspi erraticum TaxID=1685480 RepID=A0A6D2IHE6_9BRAS|nr:unnamed protein product [Microthlaspi erraticum]